MRRSGELVPAQTPKETGAKGGRGKKGVRNADSFDIPKQRLAEFRLLARTPEPDFRERIEAAQADADNLEKLSMRSFPSRADVAPVDSSPALDATSWNRGTPWKRDTHGR